VYRRNADAICQEDALAMRCAAGSVGVLPVEPRCWWLSAEPWISAQFSAAMTAGIARDLFQEDQAGGVLRSCRARYHGNPDASTAHPDATRCDMTSNCLIGCGLSPSALNGAPTDSKPDSSGGVLGRCTVQPLTTCGSAARQETAKSGFFQVISCTSG